MQAQLWAETEFEKYRILQDRLFQSDYDRYLLELEEQAASAKPLPRLPQNDVEKPTEP